MVCPLCKKAITGAYVTLERQKNEQPAHLRCALDLLPKPVAPAKPLPVADLVALDFQPV